MQTFLNKAFSARYPVCFSLDFDLWRSFSIRNIKRNLLTGFDGRKTAAERETLKQLANGTSQNHAQHCSFPISHISVESFHLTKSWNQTALEREFALGLMWKLAPRKWGLRSGSRVVSTRAKVWGNNTTHETKPRGVCENIVTRWRSRG